MFVLVINLIVQIISKDKKDESKNKNKKQHVTILNHITFIKKARYYAVVKIKEILCYVCAVISVLGLATIVIFILAKGIPHLGTEGLFALKGSYSGAQTILPSIISSLMIVLLSLIIAVPIGLGGAIFLAQYAKSKNIFTKIIKSGIEILSGIPSIIYGLFGNAFFVHVCGFQTSLLSGSLTIAIMVIPIILRSSEEAIKSVPEGYLEGSFALGAGKARTIFKTILPSALPGILTAVILAIGRIIGESAPLMLTSGNGGMDALPNGYMAKGTSLAVLLYWLNKEYTYVNEAWATAAILLMIVLVLNLLSTLIVRIMQNRLLGKR